MDRRFVIQFHDAPDGSHYDLMLEDRGALATWRLERMPAAPDRLAPMPAEKLPDHRLTYLSYEGPVSGGRGTVRIADAGRFVLLECRDDLWRVDLAGEAVRGRFSLTRLSGTRWELAGTDRPARSAPSSDRR